MYLKSISNEKLSDKLNVGVRFNMLNYRSLKNCQIEHLKLLKPEKRNYEQQ
jgi:hypothetical protein